MKKYLIITILLMPTICFASPPTRISVYTPNATISSTDVTANEDSLFNYLQAGTDTFVDGSIVNADLNASANIQSDKLNLTSINQNIANTGTFTNTGNATVTGTLTVSSTATVNSVTYATLPAGVMMAWGTTSAPTGWLICDGSAVSRTTYSGLFAVISTTYGVGDGSTTFNLPNLKGKNIIGYNSSDTNFDSMGETGGESTHTMTTGELVAHSHTINMSTNSSGGTTGYAVNSNAIVGATTPATSTTGSSTPFNVLDPYMALVYIIKY